MEGLSLPLLPAGTLVVTLAEGQRAVVYAVRSASAFPVGAAGRVVVPAGEGLWVFVIEKRSIVAVVPVAPIEAGDERSVDAGGGGVAAVVGWLQVPEADRAAVRNVDGISPPEVRVGLRDADALPALSLLNGAFVFVRGVEAGERELAIGGRGWLANRRGVKVADHMVTTVDAPLLVRGAATLLVSWSAGVDMAALDSSLGSCGATSADRSGQYEITVSACANPESCSVIREETGVPEISFGSFTVEDVPPGSYQAEMKFGKLPPVSTMVKAAPFEQTTMRLFAVYETLYGSVTHGGEPLGKDAKIKFPSDGTGFFSTDTDEYRGVLKGQIGADQEIEITTCDKELHVFVLTDQAASRSRFDLDVPDNQLVINVIDTFSREPLNAKVQYVVMSKRVPEKPVVTRTLKTLTIDGVPVREIRLSVSHPGYQPHDVDPFTMPKRGTKIVEVQLVPLRGSSGRIVSSQPFEAGRVTWLSADGIETEHADVAPDGTFIYSNTHEAGETMAVTSFSHPLWVFRMPPVARRQTMELPFPMVPTRAFEVSVANERATFIGLMIGGLLVPQVALRHHQMLRELPGFARSRHPMSFRDIAETGLIDILLGPANADTPSYGRVIDPLLLSISAKAPRKRLEPGVTTIAFE